MAESMMLCHYRFYSPGVSADLLPQDITGNYIVPFKVQEEHDLAES